MSGEKRGFYEGYRRILLIDKRLSTVAFSSTEEIIEYLRVTTGTQKGISVATLKRDIERMRCDFDAPIEFSRSRHGWYYSTSSFRLPAMFTSESELFAAELTKELFIRRLPGINTSKDAESFLDSLTATADNPYALKDNDPNRWMKNRIIALDENSEKIDDDVWNLIKKAIQTNREISFSYQGYGAQEPKIRKVRPYQLILGQGQWNMGHSYWNLYGYDCTKKQKRIFLVSHIKNPKILPASFRYDEADDYRKATNGAFGVYLYPEVYTFKLQFFWQSADMVRNRIWGDNQSIKEIDWGVELTFDSCQYHAILRWALSCGCECYPLAPKKFVDDWRRDLKYMLDSEMERNQELGLGTSLDPLPE